MINILISGFIERLYSFTFDYQGILLKLIQVNFDLNDHKKSHISTRKSDNMQPLISITTELSILKLGSYYSEH